MDFPINVQNIKGEKNKIKKGYVKGVELADGTPVNIPLMIVTGNEPGPILALTAGAHGTELVGIEVIRQLFKEGIDIKKLKGTILCIPVVNPLAVQHCSYFTPQDGIDITGVMPGNPTGTITRRIASKIWEIIVKANFMIDLHSVGAPSIPFTILRPGGKPEVQKKALEMSKAVGITITQPSKETMARRPSTMVDVLMENDIPCIVIETPFEKMMREKYIKTGVIGVKNVMKFINMIDGKPEAHSGIPIIGGPYTSLMQTATKGGIVIALKEPGEKINKGEIIANINNVFGEVVEQIISPDNGWMMGYPIAYQRNASQAVATGDFVTFIALENE